MTSSFYNGITGIKSFQSGIDIWGDNIANINTPGFKENIPEFETLFADTLTSTTASDIGLGSTLSSTAINLQEGSLINTDNPFDLAIGGKGWFKVQNGNNEFYTKNGSFTRDANGFLTDENGNYLMVANANNLKVGEKGYYIDQTINTDNLVKNSSLSPISLPDNIILPAVPTSEIKLSANLNNSDTLLNPSNATSDLYFSALYNKNGENLNMTDGQSIVYNVGNVNYNQGIFSDEICINDDKIDGEDINYDFNVNGTHIQITLPDGSKKEDIINALANKLKENNISYDTTSNSIIIKSQNNLIIKSNNDLVNNAAGAKLIYKNDPQNLYEFNTMDSLKDILGSLLNNVYPNSSINIENGQFIVNNNELNQIIHTSFEKTDNTNNLFFDNIYSLGNDVLPQTTAKSASFTANTQSFGGDLIDKDGNKDTFSIQFTKKEVLNNQTIWKANIQIKNGENLINELNQDFTFDNKGNLISPTSIKISSPQQVTLTPNITSYSKIETHSHSYSYSQNGILQGSLTKYQVDNNGNIIALFSNGQESKLATIPIFHFQNPQGLESIGSNLFKETSNSNKAFLYENKGNYISGSVIKSNTLETSNVNFSEAMTELIINQKAYGAAAKAITTSDQMIQKAINMKS